MVNDINDKEFEQKVIKAVQPVLVDMWGPGCVPCRMVAPIMDKLSQKYSGKLQFYKMNTEENPLTPAKYHVMSLPTLIIFKNGKPVDAMGALPERSLISRIDAAL
jgi:thioredoxin 1